MGAAHVLQLASMKLRFYARRPTPDAAIRLTPLSPRAGGVVDCALFILLLALILLWCRSAIAQAPCYPGVAPTQERPQVPLPADAPFLAWRSWGVGSYWYCLDPATGKWAGYYGILVIADAAKVLASGETLDSVVRALKAQFDAARTPEEKRALIAAAVARFRVPAWESCSRAIKEDIQPYRWYCEDIARVTCGPDTQPGERCRALPPDQPPPPPPASPAWVVAPTSICAATDKDASGKCVRRQAFAWDGKARGALTQDRATIGAPCVTTIGQEPYFGYDAARPDRVVACIRR